MTQPHTPKQSQYLAFIHHYTQVNGKPPAEADIQRFFRVSPPTAHQMILNLEARGLLARTPGKPRSLRVLVPSGKLPELSAEAESLAVCVIGDVAIEEVAREAEDAVRALDIDVLNSRAGSHSYGYVEPTEAAWELIEEAVMPLIEDIQRRLDAGQPDAALGTCAGVIMGLYRLRHDANDGCLGWAPDASAEMAGEAVCALRKALRKMGAPKIAGQSCDLLPTVLRDAAPEWRDMLERCWQNPS